MFTPPGRLQEDLMEANLKRVGAAALAFLATAAAAGTAFGQDAQASGEVGMTLPGAAPRAEATMGESDHDAMIGTVAVGYLGRRGILVGTPTGENEVSAPIVGVRFWLSEMLGIDAGLGFGLTSGSDEPAGAPSVDRPSTTAFLIHGGVPLSLADDGHFSFQIIPELNLGLGSYKEEQPGQPGNLEGSGFHIDIGARAGAEIHFGFIGVPKLSLQGNVGLYLAVDNTSIEDTGIAGSEAKSSSMSIGTTVLDNPWNIFMSNVAALYYF
jgi:hypothetical protein